MDDAEEQQYLESIFGPLLSISDESLVALVSNVLKTTLHKKPPFAGRVLSRQNGSYNLVHILEFDGLPKYVVRVPATGWGGQFTETVQRSFTSQALTMRFIKKETATPIPEVHYFDTTSENEIGAPYMVMSFVPGFPASELWFDQTGPTSLEERRLRTMDSLAKAMTQLQKLQFDKMGSLQFNNESPKGTPTIGPCYRWDQGAQENEDGKQKVLTGIAEFGPFKTSKCYLQHCIDNHGDKRKTASFLQGARVLVEMMIQHLPPTKKNKSDSETFVLAPPDMGFQNVMIDEQGNVTGIIDWDNAQTMPRFFGYARFPGWITRDWDPNMYHYPLYKDRENSPEELKRYRAQYKATMGKMLRGQGDSKFTGKSHIFQAVWIAVEHDNYRTDIVKKIVGRIMGEDDQGSFNILCDIVEDYLTPKEKKKLASKLASGFQALLSVSKYYM